MKLLNTSGLMTDLQALALFCSTVFSGTLLLQDLVLARPIHSINPDAHSEQRLSQLDLPAAIDPNRSNNLQGIMILGKGTASVPADDAQIEIFLYLMLPESEDDQPLTRAAKAVKVAGQPLNETEFTIKKEDLQPIVNALVKIGIPTRAIKIENFPELAGSILNGLATALIISLEKPTRERVQQIVKVVEATAEKGKKLKVAETQVQYSVNDCKRLEKVALTQAFSDAQARAKELASIANMSLGNLTFIGGYPPSSSDQDCNAYPAYDSASSLLSSDESDYDPEAPADVTVSSYVYVMYEMKP